MEAKQPTMRNIQAYLSQFMKKRCDELFKDFLPPKYTPLVQKNSIGSSEFTSPCATQIFNMCNKKQNWQYASIENVAETIIKDLKDEEGIISEFKIVVQEGTKKDDKKEKKKKEKEGEKKEEGKEEGKEEPKKKKKEKQIPKNIYIDIFISSTWAESEAEKILKNGITLDTQYTNKTVESINPNYANEPEKCGNIRDLEEFYKSAKKKFDEDPEFKKTSQLKTVDLQKGDPEARKAWQFICQISRDNFEIIYKKLGVHLKECGESFYNDLCVKIIKELEEKKVIVEDKGAKIIRVEGYKIPLIMVKSDGGIGYDTTDMAALNYRINTLKANWLIYVVASEQNDHFKMLFKAGEKAGFFKKGEVRLDHMGFGLVQGDDGKKIATRKGGSFKLIDLLKEGQENAAKEMEERNKKYKDEDKLSPEYIKEASEKLGTSAIKYFDLKQFRTTGYRFDFKKMLDDKGNTAVYLFYSYVRICSIYRKLNLSQNDIDELVKTKKIEIKEKSEKNLVNHLLLFNDVIDEVLKDLALNLLCDYVYGIATKFSEFYESCKIQGNDSRILITELCKRFMKLSFDLLSLTPIEKI